MTFPYGEIMADCRCGAGAKGNMKHIAHPNNPKLQSAVCEACGASTGWMLGCLALSGRWNRMMHEEPGTPAAPAESEFPGFEENQKLDSKARIAAGLPAPVVYEERKRPEPMPRMSEAEYLTKILGVTITDADIADFNVWLELPEQAGVLYELSQPVMFHFRAIGDRNKKLFDAWKRYKCAKENQAK